MELYSIWPAYLSFAFVFILILLPVFRGADVPPSAVAQRVSTIDGLRGFLALGVFLQHALDYHQFLRTGILLSTPSDFYDQLSQSSVAAFFMITAYLFWTRLLETGGRPGFVRLYIGRVFRIGPLYLFATLCVIGLVFLHTGLTLDTSLKDLLRAIATWSLLGIPGKWPDMNGFANTARIVVDVVWTLHYEWLFYASLLLTSFVARLRRYHLPIVAAAWLGCLVQIHIYGIFGQQNQCLFVFNTNRH